MKQRNAKPMGANALTGSSEAKRMAAIILEVLAGLRRTEDAAEALKVSLPRYYILETRALQGLIAALEPRTKGRQRRPGAEISGLTKERDQLQREVRRSQALLRAAQASAALQGFDFVLPDDVKQLAPPILGHRLVLRPESRLRKATPQMVIEQVLDRIPVPTLPAGGPAR